MTKTSRDRIRDLVRRTGRRTVDAARASSVVAEQFQEIADAALKTNPHLATGIEALREVLAYMETVGDELAALSGHAVEGAGLAADLAHEMAQVATVASNLPELEKISDRIAGRYTLPESPTEEMIQRVITNLEADIRQAAGNKVTFELWTGRDEN